MKRRLHSKLAPAALMLAALACSAAAPPASAAPKKGEGAKRPKSGAMKSAPAARPAATRIVATSAERVKKVWEVAAGGYGRAVAVSLALRKVAFANKESVSLFDLQTGKPAGEVNRCRDVVHAGLGFVGTDLVIVCEKSVVVVDGKKLGSRPAPAVSSARISAARLEGTRLVLAHRDGVIRIHDLAAGSKLEITVPGPPIDVKSLALTRSGDRLAVAWVQGSIWWWDVASPGAGHDLVRHESESDALAFDPKGTLLAEEGAPKTTTLWSFAGDKPTEKQGIRNGNWVKQLLFTPDGKWLVRAGSEGLELAEIAGPKRVALDTRGPVEDVAFDENAMYLAAADRDGRLTLWAPR